MRAIHCLVSTGSIDTSSNWNLCAVGGNGRTWLPYQRTPNTLPEWMIISSVITPGEESKLAGDDSKKKEDKQKMRCVAVLSHYPTIILELYLHSMYRYLYLPRAWPDRWVEWDGVTWSDPWRGVIRATKIKTEETWTKGWKRSYAGLILDTVLRLAWARLGQPI